MASKDTNPATRTSNLCTWAPASSNHLGYLAPIVSYYYCYLYYCLLEITIVRVSSNQSAGLISFSALRGSSPSSKAIYFVVSSEISSVLHHHAHPIILIFNDNAEAILMIKWTSSINSQRPAINLYIFIKSNNDLSLLYQTR